MYPAVGWLPLRILAAGARSHQRCARWFFWSQLGREAVEEALRVPLATGNPLEIDPYSSKHRDWDCFWMELFFLGYFYTFSDGLLGDVFKTEHHLTKTWIFRCHGDDFRMLSPNRKGYPSCQLFHVLNTLKPMGRRPNMFDKQLNIHDKPDKTKTIQHVFVVCPFVFWFEYFSQVDEHHPRLGQCWSNIMWHHLVQTRAKQSQTLQIV